VAAAAPARAVTGLPPAERGLAPVEVGETGIVIAPPRPPCVRRAGPGGGAERAAALAATVSAGMIVIATDPAVWTIATDAMIAIAGMTAVVATTGK
jgi:hypothetical protein